MNRLVGNILDLARIRAGALTPARNEAGLDEIAEAVVARVSPRLAAGRVVLEIADDVPSVAVDEMQIDQVMTNLLENAARHSPPDGDIRLSVKQAGDDVVVRVADTGPGVPPEDRERVFEAFYRGASIPDSPGTGLGLAIANAIVKAHDGRVWIEDTPGGGATFAFEIPVRHRTATIEGASAEVDDAPRLRERVGQEERT